MGKHTLEIEYDYDFALIGVSSHEKDYRFCWALNNKLGIELTKQESLEIKRKKQKTPSHFSFFAHNDEDEFKEYIVIANFSEGKSISAKESNLFGEKTKNSQSENEFLIPEHKQMNYFFVVRGEIENAEVNELIRKIKSIDIVLTAVSIDVKQLKSKQNLIF